MSFDRPASCNAELQALKAHRIFSVAATRPLAPAEVETYLAVNARIAQYELVPAAPVKPDRSASQRTSRSAAFDL